MDTDGHGFFERRGTNFSGSVFIRVDPWFESEVAENYYGGTIFILKRTPTGQRFEQKDTKFTNSVTYGEKSLSMESPWR